ncbi:MAG: glycosyltransferase family 4 protein [candidate division WOR-3 bacterium]|nr:glycosyltransferase family 4 protein [candidate division WOR-3 bacterium]
MEKILVILSNNNFSGGEKVAIEVAKALKNKFEFIFFIPKIPKESLLRKIENFKFYYAKKSIIFEALKVIDNENIKLIHSHGIRAGFWGKIIKILKPKIKHIYTIHGIHYLHRKFPLNKIMHLCETISNKFLVEKIVCVGKDDFEFLKKYSNKIILIQNGIEVENFIENTMKNEKITLLTISRLHYQKDITTLIKSISLIRDLDIVLYIIGDGPEREKLENMTKELKLEDKVVFLGFIENAENYIKNCDIFILSSRWEGLPLVILEAWKHKKPVLASNVVGIRSLISNYEDGILFELGNSVELSKKIVELVYNQNLRKSLGENGYKKLLKEYSLELMVSKYEKVYQELL